MVDRTQYKVGIVVSVESCGNQKSGKTLKACKVNVGDDQNLVTVVTAATNVREGSRSVPAPAHPVLSRTLKFVL
jgi:tRNA-binding EMAP/Myf-like protein